MSDSATPEATIPEQPEATQPDPKAVELALAERQAALRAARAAMAKSSEACAKIAELKRLGFRIVWRQPAQPPNRDELKAKRKAERDRKRDQRRKARR